MECQTQSSIDLRPANVVGVDGAASDEVPLSVLHGERQLTVQTPATKWRGIVHCGVRASITRGIGRDGRAGAELGPVRALTCTGIRLNWLQRVGVSLPSPSRGSRGWVSRFPKDRIQELTCRTLGVSVTQLIVPLAQCLAGWRGYFGFCQTPITLQNLDAWIRRRLRMYLWRQWKKAKPLCATPPTGCIPR